MAEHSSPRPSSDQHPAGESSAQPKNFEAVCGQRVGDRRVRIARPEPSFGRKLTSLVRRALASRN